MSQIYKIIPGPTGTIPPAVPTSFVTDINDTAIIFDPSPLLNGTSIPVNHVLRVAGDNGIKTTSTPNSPSGTKNLTVRFIRGSATTDPSSEPASQTKTPIIQTILNNATMTIQIIVAGFSADNLGIGAYGTAVVKNVAGTATLLDAVDLIFNRDIGLETANVTVTTSGADLHVNVIGVTGKTIVWTAALPGVVTSS